MLETIAMVFCKRLEDWLGQPEEPFLHEIELPIDPTTIRQVLREALHRCRIRHWGQIELRIWRAEIHEVVLSHLTPVECAPERRLYLQADRFLAKLETLLDPVPIHDKERSSVEYLRDFLRRYTEIHGGDSAAALLEAREAPAGVPDVTGTLETVIEEIRQRPGGNDDLISDLEDVRDVLRGRTKNTGPRTLYHDGQKDTRSGLVGCVKHAVDLSRRGWKIVDTDVSYNDSTCEVCAVGLDTAIKQAKGYRE